MGRRFAPVPNSDSVLLRHMHAILRENAPKREDAPVFASRNGAGLVGGVYRTCAVAWGFSVIVPYITNDALACIIGRGAA